ncbi:MAG: PAS domain S-box protein [Deltaproteobacteria bacterium]|nr:PAS domain S-box protein [Deltaproteobacteria bacterium]
MDSGDNRAKKGLRRINVSVGLTAVALIVLILLLAQTVRHAREKEMVRQFGLRQVGVAEGIAARLDELIAPVEKGLLALAAEPGSRMQTAWKLRAFQTGMESQVSALAVTDENGVLLMRTPAAGFAIRGVNETELFRQIKRTAAPAMGLLTIAEGGGGDRQVMTIGVPRYREGGKFTGALLAIVALERFHREYPPNGSGGDNRIWFLDSRGILLFDSLNPMAGRDVGVLEVSPGGGAFPLRDALLRPRTGHGEYRLRGKNAGGEKFIVAHAPFRILSHRGAVAIATPYDSALGPVREKSFFVIVGAAGLSLAVIVVALGVIYTARRRLSAREIEERLREREEWQEQLLHEKKTMEGIIEGSPIPTFVLNRQHKVILWNRACTELTGYSAAEMIGSENQYLPFYPEKRPVIADLILEKDFESIEKYYGTKMVKKSATVEGAYEARDFHIDLGGRNRHLYFLAAPIRDEKGEAIAAIETLQDVTREEALSKNLREYTINLQEELQENIRLREEIESLYNYLQSIVDSLPDRLYVLTADGNIHYITRNVKDGIEKNVQPLKGKPFLKLFPRELHDFVTARWEETRQGVHTPFEVSVKDKDGSPRTFLVTTGPIKGTDHYVVVERDITDHKNLEEKLYESQKLAAVGQLSAGIAHEVRNPLSSIKMTLQILEKRLNPTGNDLKRFRIAEREVEHLENLVNDVLVFAKPALPIKESADIRKVVEQALAMAEKGILDKQIRVYAAFSESVPVLEIDPAMLKQAFLNLILNAVDAMEPNGKLNVTVGLVSLKDMTSLEVEIADNGCGIAEGDMPHLFNPFFTRKLYGTGLGLTQVKKMIDLHQGIIDIFSQMGKGTRVRIRFPLPGEGDPLNVWGYEASYAMSGKGGDDR